MLLKPIIAIKNLAQRQISRFTIFGSNSASQLSTDETTGVKYAFQNSKFKYLKNKIPQIQDVNIREEIVTFKKTGNSKIFVVASKMIPTQPIRKLWTVFIAPNTTGKAISFSKFYSLKPFYVLAATEREKETCICSVCFNGHQLLNAITSQMLSDKNEAVSLTKFYNTNLSSIKSNVIDVMDLSPLNTMSMRP